MISLVNSTQGMTGKQARAALDTMGISAAQNVKYILQSIGEIHGSKGESAAKLENLLKQVHYSQLINFDYKFAITTADSMIQNNGKCLIHLKMDLLNQQN